MISFTLVELLYIVLIIAVVLLTVYLVSALTRINAVLRDVQVVSKLAAKAGRAADLWSDKAAAGVKGIFQHFADKAESKKGSNKE